MNTRFTRYFSLAVIIIFQYLMAIISVILFPGLGISFLKLSPPDNFYLAHLSLLAAFTLGIFLAGKNPKFRRGLTGTVRYQQNQCQGSAQCPTELQQPQR